MWWSCKDPNLEVFPHWGTVRCPEIYVTSFFGAVSSIQEMQLHNGSNLVDSFCEDVVVL